MSKKQVIILFPALRFDSDYSMEKTLLNLCSLKAYQGNALPRKELAQLLQARQGMP